MHAKIIASASQGDDEARGVKHKGKPVVHGVKAHVVADADTALVENCNHARQILMKAEQTPVCCPANRARYLQTTPIALVVSGIIFAQSSDCLSLSPRAWGPRRTSDAAKAQRLEPTDPLAAAPHQKDIWDMEKKLWPSTDAMGWRRQTRCPNPPYCDHLQSQANTNIVPEVR